MNSTFNQDGR
jgi:hypothetical protein